MYVDFCLNGEPFTDAKSESGILKTLELLDQAAKLAPPHMADARTPHSTKLWEARALKTLRLYELQKKEGTSSAIVEQYLLPLYRVIPYFLPRNNEVLQTLWDTTIGVFTENTKKGAAAQTVTFDKFLHLMHQFYIEKMAIDDLPTTVATAFPVFPSVCRELSQLSINRKEYVRAQEYGIEEMTMYLELDESEQDNMKILSSWERVFTCIKKIKSKASEQFFLLKDVMAEVQVYDNRVLKDRIQSHMNSIGNSKEVRYIIGYSERLKTCAKIFFGLNYDDYVATMEEKALLEEMLYNMNASEGSQDDLIEALRHVADLNIEFQREMMKAKEYDKAKKVIEDTLLIHRFTDPTQLVKGQVVIDNKTLQSIEMSIEASIGLVSDSYRSPAAMQLLTTCYDARTTYFPYDNSNMKKLWTEMMSLREFQLETLQSMYKRFCIEKQKLTEAKLSEDSNKIYNEGNYMSICITTSLNTVCMSFKA